MNNIVGILIGRKTNTLHVEFFIDASIPEDTTGDGDDLKTAAGIHQPYSQGSERAAVSTLNREQPAGTTGTGCEEREGQACQRTASKGIASF